MAAQAAQQAHVRAQPQAQAGDDKVVEAGGEADGATATAVAERQEVKRPQRYKVLLHNDDYTTMDFVVLVLTGVFHRTQAQAVKIMLQVHEQGIGVAGVYSREVAEARISKVARLAKEHEFPLRCSMEPE